MYRFFGTILKTAFFFVVLVSCSSLEQPIENWNVSDPTPLPTNWLEVSRVTWELYRYISPDGNWLVSRTLSDESLIIKVSSTDNQDVILASDPIDLDKGILDVGFPSWSPDSSSFMMTYSTKVQAPCYHRGIFIFHINQAGGKLEAVQFEPPSLDPVCAYTAWSPDGKQLAVNFNNDEIYIINSQGELLHEIDPEITEGSSLYVDVWTNFGLIYQIYYASTDWSTEFRLVDPESPEIYEILLETSDGLRIIDYDSASQQILMSRSSKYYLLDVQSKTLTQVNVIEGRDFSFFVPGWDNPYTALLIEESSTQQNSLWVYNWQTGEFTRLLQITELLGWWDDAGGFAVVTGDEQSGFEIRIISP